MAFVSDQLFDGPKLRILTIDNVFMHFGPAIDARKNYRADDVVNILERVTRTYGVPKEIRVDMVRSSSAGRSTSGHT